MAALTAEPEQASADTRIAEQVVARVDGHAILLSEVRARARPRIARLEKQGAIERVTDTQKLYAEALEARIEEEIVRAISAPLHLTIGDAEIAQTLQTLAKEYRMTPEGLLAEALAQGYTADEYRAELRRQLLKQRVIYALGARDKSAGTYPTDDAARTAWLARVENGAFAREKRKACVERFVRW